MLEIPDSESVTPETASPLLPMLVCLCSCVGLACARGSVAEGSGEAVLTVPPTALIQIGTAGEVVQVLRLVDPFLSVYERTNVSSTSPYYLAQGWHGWIGGLVPWTRLRAQYGHIQQHCQSATPKRTTSPRLKTMCSRCRPHRHGTLVAVLVQMCLLTNRRARKRREAETGVLERRTNPERAEDAELGRACTATR